jgi:hypothetical protein
VPNRKELHGWRGLAHRRRKPRGVKVFGCLVPVRAGCAVGGGGVVLKARPDPGNPSNYPSRSLVQPRSFFRLYLWTPEITPFLSLSSYLRQTRPNAQTQQNASRSTCASPAKPRTGRMEKVCARRTVLQSVPSVPCTGVHLCTEVRRWEC